MAAGFALAGMVCGVSGTVVRRPGKGQQVVIEIAARHCIVIVVMMVMLGKSRRRKRENDAKEYRCD
jgi:hypothetical protein